jgi:prepilin-type N-terminal cleavage/methylation domain-containing protein
VFPVRISKAKNGFTLVELIIVISVLAILAVGAVIAFQGIQANARRATLTSDTRSLANALNNLNGVLVEPNRITDRTAVESFIYENTFAFPSQENPRIVITFDSP